jgi:hypothetical protein
MVKFEQSITSEHPGVIGNVPVGFVSSSELSLELALTLVSC